MPRAAPWSTHRRSESGSSLIEVIAALLIMSIVGMGIWNSVAAGLRISGRIGDSVRAGTVLLSLDDRLRELASRVRIPFWSKDYLVESSADEMRVAWLDGDPAKSIIMKRDGDALVIDDGTAPRRYKGMASIAFSAASSDQGGVYGITVTVEGPGFTRREITAAFGSMPIGAAAASASGAGASGGTSGASGPTDSGAPPPDQIPPPDAVPQDQYQPPPDTGAYTPAYIGAPPDMFAPGYGVDPTTTTDGTVQ